VADGCTLLRLERTRTSPTATPRRRYVCACGEVGRWTTDAAAALAYWRTHAGISPAVTRRDALRG
jgi:hypothetical protein